jgi:hypothetical protein
MGPSLKYLITHLHVIMAFQLRVGGRAHQLVHVAIRVASWGHFAPPLMATPKNDAVSLSTTYRLVRFVPS